jgi:hypothetical protein
MLKLKRYYILLPLIPLLLLTGRPLFAETIYFFGKIGDLPVGGHVERFEKTINGWYFYYSNAKLIRIEGNIDPEGSFQMEESVDSKKTGIFKGRVSQGKWTGTWQKPTGGSPLSFSLLENHDLLKNSKTKFRFSAQERVAQYHYTYKWELELGIEDGVVKKFESTQGAYGDNKDEQICSMDLKELVQVPSEAGILLQIKDEEPMAEQPKSVEPKGAEFKSEESGGDESKVEEGKSGEVSNEEQKCTIRILGEGDILWIIIGDGSGDPNTCRSTGSAMFCSPRAFWNDLLCDRRTQKCKAIK